jgi:8-oxo-dGTP pyrophosphatase MutT (NUDIX family)
VPALRGFDDLLAVGEGALRLREDLSAADLSARMAGLVSHLDEAGHLDGQRGELFPVLPPQLGAERFRIDRAAIPWFGFPAVGLHVNGFVREGDETRMWLATRSDAVRTFPGHLDTLIGGGQPVDLSLEENLLKEAREEAGIRPETARHARPVGYVSYCVQHGRRLRPDILFCFDLELDPAFEPVALDGEVASFSLLPIEEVAEIVRTTRDFKFNCNLVIIDFLARHGHLTPEDPDYLQIVRSLRAPLDPVATSATS